ncbi:M20/M25/M40 family metallo-hydrolase [Chondromyces crocatus]|nr:M20/M25/M40 family metallo-hydrolase [Chondromyces crocatus]
MRRPILPRATAALVIALSVVCGVLLALWSFRLPEPQRDDAPAEHFSALRARRHVERLAGSPRPVGSAGHADGRAFLMAALAELGAETDAAPATAMSTWYGLPFDTARVRNVVGRLRGQASTGAVLLVAHYDSVPGSPGASDDASGVAAILEMLRAARASGPLRNDVIVLFSDGEEGGMLGAHAFVASHPWSREVRVFVNLDARGVRGVPVVIGLSSPDAWLAEQLAAAGVTSAASSVYTETTRRLHAGTDFGVLSRHGLAGVNVAFADGVALYHQGTDTTEALDLGTLQAEGDLGLALLRQLGQADLNAPRSESRVAFFSVGKLGLVRYPVAVAVALGCGALALALGALWSCRRRTPLGQLVLTGAAPRALAALAPAAIWFAWSPLARFHPVYRAQAAGDPAEVGLLRVGVILLGVSIAVMARGLIRTRRTPFAGMVSGLVVWSVLAIGLLVAMPAASHVATLPLGLGAAWVLVAQRSAPTSRAAVAVGALSTVVTTFFAAQMVYLALLAGQMPRAGWAATVLVLFTMLIPMVSLRAGEALWMRRGAVGGALIALGCFVVAALGARFDAEHPRPTCLTYALDGSTGDARWISDERVPSAWSAAFLPADAERAPLPAFFDDATRPLRQAPAPAHALQAPQLVVEQDERAGDRRVLHLRLRSARRAPWAFVFVEGGATILAASVEGKAIDPDVVTEPLAQGQRWGFRHVGLEEDGLAFTLEVAAESAPLRLRVVDQRFELPPEVPVRPADMAACRSWITDSTLVSEVFAF